MEITKLNLDSEKIYEIFMKDEPEGHPTRLAYYIEETDLDNPLRFGGNGEAAYHVVMDGSVVYKKDDEAAVSIGAGNDFYCELENTMEVTGNGRILSMVMEKGVRGIIRKIDLQNEKMIKIGEAIGESCVALVGIDGAFNVECEQEIYTCEQNEILFIRMNRKEYSKIRLLSKKSVQVELFNAIKMCSSDFSSHIGVYTLEQGYGYCKVRMDIKKEHMNPIGSIHGGALFTMADQACGIAAATTGGVCTTVDSHIEFLNAELNVKYLTAEAKPKKIGKKIRTFNVDIRDEKDVLIASADFIFYSLQN